jgi:hypothetical protein
MKDDDDTCDRGLDPTPHNLWCCALCDAENRVTGFELCKVCLTYAQEDALAAAQDRLCGAKDRLTGFELCKVCLTYAQEDALAAAQDRDDKEENA